MADPKKLCVLFLCTGNSYRSQMAEGWAKALKADSVEAYSAGTNPHGLNPLAVRAMKEAGVDISTHRSKQERPEDNREDPLYRRVVERFPTGSKPSDHITSLDVIVKKSHLFRIR